MPQKDDKRNLQNNSETLIEKQERMREMKETPEKLSFIRNALNGLALNVLDDRVRGKAQELINNDKVDEAWKVLENEEQLKSQLDKLDKLKLDYGKYKHLLSRPKGESGFFSEESFDSFVDGMLIEDEKTGKWKMRSLPSILLEKFQAEWENEGVWGVFTGTWESIKALGKYLSLKRYEKELVLAKTGFEVGGEMKKRVEEVRVNVHDAKETIHNITDPLKENPITKSATRNVVSRLKESGKSLFKNGKTINSQEFLTETKTLFNKTISEGVQMGKGSFIKEIAQHKVPGMNLRMSGKFIAVEVLSRSLLEAIRTGNLGDFPETLMSSNTWIEAIPGVGSWHSVKRLFSDNGDPLWAKVLDAGMNVVGDGMLVAGIVGSVFTFGASGAAGVGGRAALIAGGRKLLRTFTMKEIKSTIKKQGIKALSKEAGEEVFEEGAKAVVKQQGKKSFLKEVVLSTGKWTLGMHAMEEIFQQIFPDGYVTNVVTDIALDQLTPQQRRLVEMGVNAKSGI